MNQKGFSKNILIISLGFTIIAAIVIYFTVIRDKPSGGWPVKIDNLNIETLSGVITFNKRCSHCSLIDKNEIAKVSLQYLKSYPGYKYRYFSVADLQEQAGLTVDTYRFRAWFRPYLTSEEEADNYIFDIEYNPKVSTYQVIMDSLSIARAALPTEVKERAFELAKTNNLVQTFVTKGNVTYEKVDYRWYLSGQEIEELKKEWPAVSGDKWILITVGHTRDSEPWPYFALVNLDQGVVYTGGRFSWGEKP